MDEVHERTGLQHATRGVLNEESSRIEVVYYLQGLLDERIRVLQISWALCVTPTNAILGALRAGPHNLEVATRVNGVVPCEDVLAYRWFELGISIQANDFKPIFFKAPPYGLCATEQL